MFDHISFGVTNLPERKQFLLKAVQPLGVTVAMEGPYGVGTGQNKKPSLWLNETKERPARLHLAFIAESRKQVDIIVAAGDTTSFTEWGSYGPRRGRRFS